VATKNRTKIRRAAVPDVQLAFARLLRGLRTEAGLTQEELAEAAGLTSRAISYLERGEVATPRRATVRLLADALQLADPARAEFVQAARGRPGSATAATAPEGLAATRALPRDVASFTGRQRELAELSIAAGAAPGGICIHAIGGMAGTGKTAFAVHAAHRLADRYPDSQIFLPLHGHTPDLQPTEAVDALASLLTVLGIPPAQIPAGLEARAALWRHCVAGRRLLLILDDAVSSEQVEPLLPGSGGSLVLITSRRHLTALAEAVPVSLDTLPADQACALLVRLAGRSGLSPDDPAIAELARLCGCLPLAIGMVARQLRHHPAWTPAGRAAELAAAANRLATLSTENLSVTAAFDLSYASLSEEQQRLFRRLGLHPGSEVDVYAAAALDGIDLGQARRGLEDLYDRHLLTEPVAGRYRLHDLIREHAGSLGSRIDPTEERDAATQRLLDYYQHAAVRADVLLSRVSRPAPVTADGTEPAAVRALATPEEALTWAGIEQANLLACLDLVTHYAQHERVVALTAGLAALWEHAGPWNEAIARHTVAIAAAGHIGDVMAEARATDDLGTLLRLTGDYPAAERAHRQALGCYSQTESRLGRAAALHCLGDVLKMKSELSAAAAAHEEALGIYRDLGDRPGTASALSSLGDVLQVMADYPAAIRAQDEALSIFREIGNRSGEGSALGSLGVVLRLTDDYPAAAQAQQGALSIFREIGNRLGAANALNRLGDVLQRTGDCPAAILAQQEALSIFRDLGNRVGAANALNGLGDVLRLTGDYATAATAQREALDIYRQIGHRHNAGNALGLLGVVLRLMGDFEAASQALNEALVIFREIGDRGAEAYVLNEIGTLRLACGEPAEEFHRQALELARAIGSSSDEAQGLAGLGRCFLAAGQTAEGEAELREALAILVRLKSPAAAGVAAELEALNSRAVLERAGQVLLGGSG
jgi:tetratricopeptide (TPR) repeat protein/transcriptional regulator with XRE-family HTH domain